MHAHTPSGLQAPDTRQAPRQAEPRLLEPGQALERELAGGEAHAYRIRLTSGQYVRVGVEQKGVDVGISVSGPGGKRLARVDRDPAVGKESVFIIADSAGDYGVEVASTREGARPGRYEVRIEELRIATPADQRHAAAEKLYEEASLLRDQQAAEARKQAIKKYEESLPLWREVGDRRGEAYTLHELGYLNSVLNNLKEALDHYGRALPLWRELGDRVNEGATLGNAGLVHWKLGELTKALEYYNLALPLRRAVGDRVGEGSTLSNAGLIYHGLGDLDEALAHYKQALALRRETGDRAGEASTLTNIGEVHRRLGEMQKALDYYDQALPLWRATGNSGTEGLTLNNIGAVYAELGETQKALEYYGRALPLRRESGDRRGAAQTLHNVGKTHGWLGARERALDYLGQALTLFTDVGDRIGQATVLSSIGDVHVTSGEGRKALDNFGRALALRKETGDRHGEAVTLNSVGLAHARLGETQRALDSYDQALRLSRLLGDRAGEARVLLNLARAQRDSGDAAGARASIEAALDIIELTRSKLASRELRTSLLSSRQEYYELYVDLLMRLHGGQPSAGYDAAALRASERARARGLLETLVEARADIRRGADPILLERERQLQRQLSAKSERLTRLLSARADGEQGAAARREVEALLGEYKEVEAQIRARSPRYAALTQPAPLSLSEIQTQVLDPETLLLEYALGEERSYLWAVTSDSIKSFVLPPRSEIEAAARRVYDLLTARNRVVKFEEPAERAARVAEADAAFPREAGALARLLVGPAAEEIRGRRLLVVADGVLQYIPFAALPLPGPAARGAYVPLIAEHEVVSLPSVSALALLRRELAGRRVAPRTVAVLADPVFGEGDERVRLRTSARATPARADAAVGVRAAATRFDADLTRAVRFLAGGAGGSAFQIPRLPFTRREAEAIVALAPAPASMKAVDFAASREAALSPALGQYRYVHFATHAILNTEHPELSGIVLSLVDADGRYRDGFLMAHEIYNLDLPAELVVLSGCRTGLGREAKGEGLLSLTRGFMYAGGRRVVVSLWDVNDQSTAELMPRLYEGVIGRRRLSPAAALRRAQLALWKSRRWGAPYYWAAFVLHGEYR